MKKTFCILLALALALSLCACGGAGTSASAGTGASSAAAPSAAAASGAADSLAQDEAELSAIGDVEVVNGILTVSVTMPAEFVGDDTTQETLDRNAGESYVSAKLNEDGSVTYKLTKAQYHTMLDGMTAGMEEGLQSMIDDDTYSISAIEHNGDYTQFDVTLDSGELGTYDSIMVIAFYAYGGLYGVFTGKTPASVVVNFYGPDGTLIKTANSAEANSTANSAA